MSRVVAFDNRRRRPALEVDSFRSSESPFERAKHPGRDRENKTGIIEAMDDTGVLDGVGAEWELSPAELQSVWREHPELVVVDCREPSELAAASIAGVVHIPMNELPTRIEELDPRRDTVVICHHGVRSLRVASWLSQRAGFARIKSLRGGIDAWAVEIDPSIGRY